MSSPAPASPPAATASPGNLAVLGLVVFVAMTGFGTIIPVLPFLALGFGASATEATWAMGAYSLGQLLASPVWGRISDRYGRKPVLVISLVGATACYLWLATAQTVQDIGLARFVGGIMAGNVAAAFAYATDISTPTNRAKTMGLMGAAFGLGFIIGPAIGGFMAGADAGPGDLARIATLSAVLSALAAAACLIWLPESRDAAARARPAPKVSLAGLTGRPLLLGLLGGGLALLTAFALMESIFGLWAEAVFSWTPFDVAVAFSMFGILSAALQGGATGRLSKRFGEGQLLRVGLGLYVAGFAVMYLATTPVWAYVGLGLLAVAAGIAGPALQTLVSLQAAEHERGAVMGALQSAMSGGRVLGPLIAGPAFDQFGEPAPFAAGVSLLLLTLLLVWPATARARGS
jgi:DHA1 family tetracycline resistance protein-like MFS transporter